METTWCVYRHTAPDGRKYIGIAEQPAKTRWANGKGYKTNPAFWECIQSVGWENIKHEIVEVFTDKFYARKVERRLINEECTLTPNGFNRIVDNPDYNNIKHKRELGDIYGFCKVRDYWGDKDGYKVYKMECVCGKIFNVKWRNMTDDLSCGCRN